MTSFASAGLFSHVPRGDFAVTQDAYGLPPEQDGYSIARFHSGKGRNDFCCEGVYSQFAIGMVLAGAFEYKSGAQAGLAVPGAIIFANRSQEFHCRHLTDDGHHRLVIFLDENLIRSVVAAAGRRRFPATSLIAPSAITTRALGAVARMLAAPPEARFEEIVALVETCLAADRNRLPGRKAGGRERDRVVATVRYINDHFTDDCSLDRLAAIAGVSKYRFARAFREVTGETAAQYVANRRLSAAATRLAASHDPVSAVAFECGFNDISYFNARFRATFGAPPSKWRMRRGAYRSAVHNPG